ncbi:peptidyl-prolyl cis-trans isomerase [Fibrobacter succinogenes]|uniref:peptidyl-prolyl cis-trans isomerase n=1 Tax=Fibrobacter succinogenes TaxID=833 RepID=UPI0015661470|nr:peptidyl-prolyl cis-trans isomerase [Fibrobacter succinogenes]
MNKKFLFISSLCCAALMGCNGIGAGEDKVARVDNEIIYAEDLDLAIKLSGADRSSEGQIASDLIAKAALVSKALQEFPELGSRWDAYSKNLEDRLLTLVYQRYYSMECLMFSDADLRNYFNTHKSEFVKDSSEVQFVDVRGAVAEHLLISREAEKFKEAGGDTVNFLQQYRRNLMETSIKEINEKYPVKIEKIVPPDAESYYESHKEEFKTAHAFEVYHVQMEDSAALAKLFQTPVKDLEQFKHLAAKYSENKETAANGGYVGKVKDGFALPYGIGIINGLGDALKGKPEGTISPVLATSMTPARHVFYLVKEFPPEVKPFDRVKGDVENRMLNGAFLELDSSYVLISKNGKPYFTEGSFLNILAEEPGMPKNNRSRERIVRSLAESASFAEEARSLKLERSWEYRAFMRQTRGNYILAHYEEMAVNNNDLLPEDTLKAFFEKNGNPMRPRLGFEDSKQDISDYINFPENILKHEYYFNNMLYKGRSIEDVRKQVVSNNLSGLRAARKARREADILAAADVRLFRNDLSVLTLATPADLIRSADSLYKMLAYDASLAMWKKVRDRYPENDSLYALATFQIAQVESEAERFSMAEAEYYTYYMMWPKSPDAEKAMFSRGFVLNENMHKDTLALQVLEEFQKTYPNSDLGKDVDWLIENIKSGGKLAEDLMKKIEAEE